MYLIDTNILIYHFADQIPVHAQETIDKLFKDHFNISVVTKIKFLGWNKIHGKQLKKAIDLNKPVVDKTIWIKQSHNIKLPDAIIAATALLRKLILVTRNAEDFKGIKIKIYNPFSEI